MLTLGRSRQFGAHYTHRLRLSWEPAAGGDFGTQIIACVLHGESSKRLASPRNTKDQNHLQNQPHRPNRHTHLTDQAPSTTERTAWDTHNTNCVMYWASRRAQLNQAALNLTRVCGMCSREAILEAIVHSRNGNRKCFRRVPDSTPGFVPKQDEDYRLQRYTYNAVLVPSPP